jgi:DNA-binding MarR family transcriptional regulator
MQLSRVNPGPAPAAIQLADRLHTAALRLLRRLRQHDVLMGLSPAKASALSVLVFAGERTLGQLAAIEQVRAPTITRLVAGMERQGLVRRHRDAHDQRVVWIRATPKGERLLQAGRERRVAALAGDLERLDALSRRRLSEALDVLASLAGDAPAASSTAPGDDGS